MPLLYLLITIIVVIIIRIWWIIMFKISFYGWRLVRSGGEDVTIATTWGKVGYRHFRVSLHTGPHGKEGCAHWSEIWARCGKLRVEYCAIGPKTSVWISIFRNTSNTIISWTHNNCDSLQAEFQVLLTLTSHIVGREICLRGGIRDWKDICRFVNATL